jgi:transcription-repair coupling factor (superfamily II helicase)
MDMADWGMYSVPGLLMTRADWVLYMRSTTQTNAKKNQFGAVKHHADSVMPPEIVVHTREGNGFFAKVRTEKIENVKDSYVIDVNYPDTSKQIFIDLLK